MSLLFLLPPIVGKICGGGVPLDSKQIEAVANWFVHNIIQILLILSIFIQITPIKWNPWTTIIKWAGKIINKDLINKVDTISQSVEKLQKDRYEDEKDRIRWETLEFATSCRNGVIPTRDEFQHIIALNDKYMKLLKITNDQNGVFEEEYKYIQKLYADHLLKNDFL